MKMNEVTIEGIIGNGKCAPIRKLMPDQTGTIRPVMWFTLLYNDNAWKNTETGKTERNRKFLKVFLPRNNYGETIFNNLACGRHISVTGTVKADIFVTTKEDGSKEHLPSLTMSDTNVQFLDLPLEKQLRNLLEIADERGLIAEDGSFLCNAKELVDSISEYAGQLKGKTIENKNVQQDTGTTGIRKF